MTDNQNNISNQEGPSTPEGFVPLAKFQAMESRYQEAMIYIGRLVFMIEKATGLPLFKEEKLESDA